MDSPQAADAGTPGRRFARGAVAGTDEKGAYGPLPPRPRTPRRDEIRGGPRRDHPIQKSPRPGIRGLRPARPPKQCGHTWWIGSNWHYYAGRFGPRNSRHTRYSSSGDSITGWIHRAERSWADTPPGAERAGTARSPGRRPWQKYGFLPTCSPGGHHPRVSLI